MDDEALRAMYHSHEEATRNSMNLSDDWTMRDLPWMKREFYEQLLGILGEGNYKFMSGSTRSVKLVHNEDGTPKGHEKLDHEMVRATLFINKQGRENIKAYAEQVRT